MEEEEKELDFNAIETASFHEARMSPAYHLFSSIFIQWMCLFLKMRGKRGEKFTRISFRLVSLFSSP